MVCVRPVVLHCTGDLLPAPDDWSRGDRHGNEVARLNRDHLLLDEFAGEVLAEVSALHRVVEGRCAQRVEQAIVEGAGDVAESVDDHVPHYLGGVVYKAREVPNRVAEVWTSSEHGVHEGSDGLKVTTLQLGVAWLGRLDELKAWLHWRRERTALVHAKLGECRLQVSALGHEDAPAGEVGNRDTKDVFGTSEVLHAVERVEVPLELDRLVAVFRMRDGEDLIKVQHNVDVTVAEGNKVLVHEQITRAGGLLEPVVPWTTRRAL